VLLVSKVETMEVILVVMAVAVQRVEHLATKEIMILAGVLAVAVQRVMF
jgi:hypothetical protein|tara:strand:+ start:291 stop:437 length:147 start_codon:yes stop_codon:yes gene_type:complete